MRTLLFFFLLLPASCFSQKELPKHIFSVGSGMSDRGLANVQYDYNFHFHDNIFLSIESAIGITGDIAFCGSVAPTLNFGSAPSYFSFGFDNKYVQRKYFTVEDKYWGWPFSDSYGYKGYIIAPFIGYNLIGAERVNFKVRLCLNIMTKNFYGFQLGEPKEVKIRPGIGVSIGLFKKRGK